MIEQAKLFTLETRISPGNDDDNKKTSLSVFLALTTGICLFRGETKTNRIVLDQNKGNKIK